MKTTLEVTYPAPLDAVMAMFADESYLRGRLPGQVSNNAHVQAHTTDQGVSSTLNLTVARQSLPSAAQRMVSADVSVRVNESWMRTSPTQARGEITLNVDGAPVSGGASAQARQEAPDRTVITVDADVNVHVPLVGRAAEKAALSHVSSVISREQTHARHYLAHG